MILSKTDFEINSVVFGADISKPKSHPFAVEQPLCSTFANVFSPENYCFSNFANRTTLLVGEST